MRKQDHRIYEFADFRVEMAERVLKRNGQAVPLRPKLFDLLVFLLEHRGVILEKDEITSAVWGGVSQGSAEQPSANLTVNISNLRQTLGDDSDKPMFIETVPYRGYRFIALVRVEEAALAKPAEARLAAISAASGGSHQVFSSAPETAAARIPSPWPEPASGSASNSASGGELDFRASMPDDIELPALQNQNKAALAAGKPASAAWGSSRWTLIAASSVLAAMTVWLVWAMAGQGSGFGSKIAVSSSPVKKESPGGNADLPASAGKQTEDSTVAAPRIDSIEPAMPPAWIGDKPIKVTGNAFRPGLSVTILFPGSGSATLGGVAVLNVTPNDFTLLADFNNNPGEYRIRVNSPDGLYSNWWVFDVLPASLLPEITEVKHAGMAQGKLRVTIAGSNFLQSVSAVLVYPDGQREHLPGHRVSSKLFQVLFDSHGQTGPFKLQAQNMGKGSNVVSFHLSSP